MKSIFFSLFVLFGLTAKAQNTSVTVQAENFKNENGTCRACLYNTAEGFPEDNSKAIQCKSIKIIGKKAALSFENIPNGKYAILVYHDENNNNKQDVNFFGIPKESYGASQNKIPTMSKPSFEDNSFKVNGRPQTIIIKLRII